MLPRRSSNPSLSSSRQQKYLINSEVCLPKIVNKLVIRKPSYQNRWMTPILGSHKREYRSLQAFESQRRVEVRVSKQMMQVSAVKQKILEIQKQDIRVHNKTEVMKERGSKQRIHTTESSEVILSRKSSLAMRIKKQAEQSPQKEQNLSLAPMFSISTIKPLKKNIDCVITRKFEQTIKMRRHNRIQSFDLGTKQPQISQLQEHVTQIGRKQSCCKLLKKIQSVAVTANILAKPSLKRAEQQQKSCPIKKKPCSLKQYLNSYNPEKTPYKDRLKEIEVNLREVSQQRTNRKRANFWNISEGTISPWN